MRSLEIADVKAFSSLAPPNKHYISYQLYFRLNSASTIDVGRLGTHTFPSGNYVYTGSARRNIRARVLRHLSGQQKLHWHIDYLLSCAGVTFSKVVLSALSECELNRQTTGKVVVRRFGSTDCGERCGSHLKFIEDTNRTNRQLVRM